MVTCDWCGRLTDRWYSHDGYHFCCQRCMAEYDKEQYGDEEAAELALQNEEREFQLQQQAENLRLERMALANYNAWKDVTTPIPYEDLPSELEELFEFSMRGRYIQPPIAKGTKVAIKSCYTIDYENNKVILEINLKNNSEDFNGNPTYTGSFIIKLIDSDFTSAHQLPLKPNEERHVRVVNERKNDECFFSREFIVFFVSSNAGVPVLNEARIFATFEKLIGRKKDLFISDNFTYDYLLSKNYDVTKQRKNDSTNLYISKCNFDFLYPIYGSYLKIFMDFEARTANPIMFEFYLSQEKTFNLEKDMLVGRKQLNYFINDRRINISFYTEALNSPETGYYYRTLVVKEFKDNQWQIIATQNNGIGYFEHIKIVPAGCISKNGFLARTGDSSKLVFTKSWRYSFNDDCSSITFYSEDGILKNNSSWASGTLKLVVWLCPDVYKGGTLEGTQIGELIISTESLQAGYFYSKPKWTIPITGNTITGDYHVVFTVNEYHENDKWYIADDVSFQKKMHWTDKTKKVEEKKPASPEIELKMDKKQISDIYFKDSWDYSFNTNYTSITFNSKKGRIINGSSWNSGKLKIQCFFCYEQYDGQHLTGILMDEKIIADTLKSGMSISNQSWNFEIKENTRHRDYYITFIILEFVDSEWVKTDFYNLPGKFHLNRIELKMDKKQISDIYFKDSWDYSFNTNYTSITFNSKKGRIINGSSWNSGKLKIQCFFCYEQYDGQHLTGILMDEKIIADTLKSGMSISNQSWNFEIKENTRHRDYYITFIILEFVDSEWVKTDFYNLPGKFHLNRKDNLEKK